MVEQSHGNVVSFVDLTNEMGDSDVTLEQILAEPEAILLFREFLKGSYSSENLAFIVEVENFKDLWSQGAEDDFIKKRAKEIFEKYFVETSNYELNIPGPLFEDLKERMKNPNTSTFNKVQQSVFKLVETDSFPRFVKSPLFLDNWAELKKKKGKKDTNAKGMQGVFKKEKKKNPLFSKLSAEVEGDRNNRSSTVAILEEFFSSRNNSKGDFNSLSQRP